LAGENGEAQFPGMEKPQKRSRRSFAEWKNRKNAFKVETDARTGNGGLPLPV